MNLKSVLLSSAWDRIATWLAIVGVIVGTYMFLSDLRQDLTSVLESLHDLAEGERQSGRTRLAYSERRFAELETAVQDVMSVLAKTNGDLNYRMGVHVGGHEALIKDLEQLLDKPMGVCSDDD